MDDTTKDSSTFNEIPLTNNDMCDEYEYIDSVETIQEKSRNTNGEYIPTFNEYERKQLDEQLRNVN